MHIHHLPGLSGRVVLPQPVWEPKAKLGELGHNPNPLFSAIVTHMVHTEKCPIRDWKPQPGRATSVKAGCVASF